MLENCLSSATISVIFSKIVGHTESSTIHSIDAVMEAFCQKGDFFQGSFRGCFRCFPDKLDPEDGLLLFMWRRGRGVVLPVLCVQRDQGEKRRLQKLQRANGGGQRHQSVWQCLSL